MVQSKEIQATCERLKTDLLEKINNCDAEGKYTDAQYDSITETIDKLCDYTAIPEPMNQQEKISDPWISRFASFGPKHTAGKPIEHDTNFGRLSFGKMPSLPIRMMEITQEIEVQSKAYNNITRIQNAAGSLVADLIIYGKYSRDDDNPQRYIVDFHECALLGLNGEGDDELREGFGMEPDQALRLKFDVPTFHSDVVFCDDTMRINFGKLGGVYVMERLATSGRSVSFDR